MISSRTSKKNEDLFVHFAQCNKSVHFSGAVDTNGRTLLGPQASSPANVSVKATQWRVMQARTPAVPEERARLREGGY